MILTAYTGTGILCESLGSLTKLVNGVQRNGNIVKCSKRNEGRKEVCPMIQISLIFGYDSFEKVMLMYFV